MRCIDKCLTSLEGSTIPLTPLIIDNSSIDGTVEFIKQNFPRNEIIENTKNYGFGKANNIGFKYAIDNMADFVLLLNQDVFIEPDTVEKLLDTQVFNPHFGILSPVHLNGKGNRLDRNFSTCIPFKTLSEIEEFTQSGTKSIETNFVNAAVWLIPISMILSVGGFDPLFFHYGEDRDYCYRASFHGYKIGIVLKSSICHDRVYLPDNQYRSTQNLLFSVALAHLKNLNNKFIYNYFTLIIQRLKRCLKWLLLRDYSSFYVEIIIQFKLLFLIRKILGSRMRCKSIGSHFLSQ